jgi:predicted metalloprotease with PDZ domain
MPEREIDKMRQQLRDFAAHEFFHIVTPLSVHSEEIDHFDFNDPNMSKHLWMYEGVTEYFAGNVQVKYGLITQQEYLNILRSKMINADQFQDSISFTDLSKFTIGKYASQYGNVYQKGALIGMCLDIRLRDLSDGKYGLQNLMEELAKKYGKSRPFNDDELFATIEQLTFPEIGEFFRLYVEGPNQLPLKEIFKSVGINYERENPGTEFNIGFSPPAIRVVNLDSKVKLSIGNIKGLTKQGELLGLKEGDVLLRINNEEIPDPGPGIVDFFNAAAARLHEGDSISYSILRKDQVGEFQLVELKAKVIEMEIIEHHVLGFNDACTSEELLLRKSWLESQ